MHNSEIQPKEWHAIHPCKHNTDTYYIQLANQLYASVHNKTKIKPQVRRSFCLYAAAYLEDLRSDLQLWSTFRQEHQQLYNTPLPFYNLPSDYQPQHVNEDDLRFLLWNTWQKSLQHNPSTAHTFLNPFHEDLLSEAHSVCQLLEQAYAEAPCNDDLTRYFRHIDTLDEADTKLNWLLGHTYLTEPAMQPYIQQIEPTDRFIIPTGPLALFLYEWLEALHCDASWRAVDGLYLEEPQLPDLQKLKNAQLYETFLEATGGNDITFLADYPQLRKFLVDGLHWPNDTNHTLPQLAHSRDFVLMVNREKGMLLAKDIARNFHTPLNPLYSQSHAQQHSYQLLSQETLCPPDLLTRSIREGWLTDLSQPGVSPQHLTANADFIARCLLLYYYRGD